jgi:hypothetical protein
MFTTKRYLELIGMSICLACLAPASPGTGTVLS